MGDVKVTLASKIAIEGKKGYSYTYNKVDETNKTVGSLTIYDYEGDGFDNHDGVVNNGFGEVTTNIFSTMMKDNARSGGYQDTKVEENPSAPGKKFAEAKVDKTDTGFNLTNDNKTEFSLGSLAKSIDYKPTSAFQSYWGAQNGLQGGFPMFNNGAAGNFAMANVDSQQLAEVAAQAQRMFSFLTISSYMGGVTLPPFALTSAIGDIFNNILNCFGTTNIGTPDAGSDASKPASTDPFETLKADAKALGVTVDDKDTLETLKPKVDAKKLENLKEEAKKLGVTVDEKDTLETLQPKVDAKKLEDLKAEATKLGISYEKDVTLDSLQSLVDDKKGNNHSDDGAGNDKKGVDAPYDGKAINNGTYNYDKHFTGEKYGVSSKGLTMKTFTDKDGNKVQVVYNKDNQLVQLDVFKKDYTETTTFNDNLDLEEFVRRDSKTKEVLYSEQGPGYAAKLKKEAEAGKHKTEAASKIAGDFYVAMDGVGTNNDLLVKSLNKVDSNNVMEVSAQWNKNYASIRDGKSLVADVMSETDWEYQQEGRVKPLKEALIKKAESIGLTDEANTFNAIVTSAFDTWFSADKTKIAQAFKNLEDQINKKIKETQPAEGDKTDKTKIDEHAMPETMTAGK